MVTIAAGGLFAAGHAWSFRWGPNHDGAQPWGWGYRRVRHVLSPSPSRTAVIVVVGSRRAGGVADGCIRQRRSGVSIADEAACIRLQHHTVDATR